MKIKTSELIGPALDWAVAKCEEASVGPGYFTGIVMRGEDYCPSTDWAQGGPIIEQRGIHLSTDFATDAFGEYTEQIGWKANVWNNSVPGTSGFMQWGLGPTPLIAAMRCFVSSRLGNEVDIPEELA